MESPWSSIQQIVRNIGICIFAIIVMFSPAIYYAAIGDTITAATCVQMVLDSFAAFVTVSFCCAGIARDIQSTTLSKWLHRRTSGGILSLVVPPGVQQWAAPPASFFRPSTLNFEGPMLSVTPSTSPGSSVLSPSSDLEQSGISDQVSLLNMNQDRLSVVDADHIDGFTNPNTINSATRVNPIVVDIHQFWIMDITALNSKPIPRFFMSVSIAAVTSFLVWVGGNILFIADFFSTLWTAKDIFIHQRTSALRVLKQGPRNKWRTCWAWRNCDAKEFSKMMAFSGILFIQSFLTTVSRLFKETVNSTSHENDNFTKIFVLVLCAVTLYIPVMWMAFGIIPLTPSISPALALVPREGSILAGAMSLQARHGTLPGTIFLIFPSVSEKAKWREKLQSASSHGVLGVSGAFLKRLLDRHSKPFTDDDVTVPSIEGLSTGAVCLKVLKPLTRRVQRSYYESLLSKEAVEAKRREILDPSLDLSPQPGDVGPATVFVSHAWSCEFTELVNNVLTWEEVAAKSEEERISTASFGFSRQARESGRVGVPYPVSYSGTGICATPHYYYLDVIFKDQWLATPDIPENPTAEEKAAIASYSDSTLLELYRSVRGPGRLLLSMDDNWKLVVNSASLGNRATLLSSNPSPVALCRVWCCYELYTIIHNRGLISCMQGHTLYFGCMQRLLRNVFNMSTPSYHFIPAISTIDISVASATMPADKFTIMNKVESTIGVSICSNNLRLTLGQIHLRETKFNIWISMSFALCTIGSLMSVSSAIPPFVMEMEKDTKEFGTDSIIITAKCSLYGLISLILVPLATISLLGTYYGLRDWSRLVQNARADLATATALRDGQTVAIDSPTSNVTNSQSSDESRRDSPQ